MPLDVRRLLEETGALLSGHFRLSSGLHSANYVQCALLLEHPRNAKAVGEALAEKLRGLGAAKIVAPALGGVIIGYTVAEALDVPFVFTERKDGQMTLRRGFRLQEGERVVIVEDVVTTGKSTRETADVIAQHGGVVTGFASILNRSGKPNPFDAPYEFLLALDFPTHEESACPHCERGVALDAPGSRFQR
ncbi:MAG: orotate phosphoribosyltransferase [Acidobacteriota bacterium]|nr:orotate phosphoribosyltransferase [Acidobacteriota bacterium]